MGVECETLNRHIVGHNTSLRIVVSTRASALEPKQLPGWMMREAQTIPESDVSMPTEHLSRYVRTYKRDVATVTLADAHAEAGRVKADAKQAIDVRIIEEQRQTEKKNEVILAATPLRDVLQY